MREIRNSIFNLPEGCALTISRVTSFNDWFLPSIDELSEMHSVLHLNETGEFSDEIYWSSTESGEANAFYVDFTDPEDNVASGLKNETYYIRATRSFTSLVNYDLMDIGPSGGWVFWKSGNNYLEAAPIDSMATHWSNIQIEIGITAQGSDIGTGHANTNSIISQVGHVDSAALRCDQLILGSD